jgi:hypothetical protein
VSLSRLYNLDEATRIDRQISIPEIERRWPEAMAAFDRDVGTEVDTHRVSFYLEAGSGDQLIANVRGGGWWQWDPVPTVFTGRGGEPGWTKIGKPGTIRGGSGRERDGFSGNLGSHQDRRATLENNYDVPDKTVAQMFGAKAVRDAQRIQPDPSLRSFAVIQMNAFKGPWTKMQRRASRSKTVALTLNIWSEPPQRPVDVGDYDVLTDQELMTAYYEWDERSDSWKRNDG